MAGSTKKRPAVSQGGSVPKKAHTEKPASKKRSRPITLPTQPTQNSDESDEDENGDDFGLADEKLEEENFESIDTGTPKTKDPNAARESHKAQKALHSQRKASKPYADLLLDAKRAWALARQKNIPTTKRQKHVAELMEVLRGNVKDIVFKHDASRIVQTAVKYGGQEERDEIALELKGRYKELAQNRYSKFLVSKLIRYSSHRASILQEFQSHVTRLLLHREATSVLADAFELYANAYERSILLRDFYGKETLLFSKNAEQDKDKARKGLSGVLEGLDDEKKKRILNATKENLVSIFNNEDKGAVTHAVVHRALWEYISAVNNLDDEAEQDRRHREIFECCQDTLAELVHTKDGSRVVREFIARGGAKDRKQILKVLKPHVERMCTDDEAQLVLFTALDVTDDTKLISKSIIAPITASASEMCKTPQGRRSLFYLLVPRTRRHFTPAQISTLAETDTIRAKTSKKDPKVREEEVRHAASEELLSWVEQHGKGASREPGSCLVVTEVMLYANGDKSKASQTLIDAIRTTEYPSSDPSHPHSIDLPHTSRMYKTLLQGGHFNRVTSSIERVDVNIWDPSVFAASFTAHVGQGQIVDICIKGESNGCFVVAELCEALKNSPARKTLKDAFSPQIVKQIEGGEAKGKRVLLEKLTQL